MNFAEQRPLEQEGQNADHDQNRQVWPERCGPCPDGHRRRRKPKQATFSRFRSCSRALQVKVQLKRHTDKQTKREATGRQTLNILVCVRRNDRSSQISSLPGATSKKRWGCWAVALHAPRQPGASQPGLLGLPAYGGGHRRALRPALPGGALRMETFQNLKHRVSKRLVQTVERCSTASSSFSRAAAFRPWRRQLCLGS